MYVCVHTLLLRNIHRTAMTGLQSRTLLIGFTWKRNECPAKYSNNNNNNSNDINDNKKK